MDYLTFSLRELLIAAVLAGMIYLVDFWLSIRRRREHSRFRAASTPTPDPGIDALRTEIAALSARVEALEKQLKSREEDFLSPYARAIQLAREGATAGELSSRCGISRGEAELIIALNRSGS
jgi:cell division protein FtsB